MSKQVTAADLQSQLAAATTDTEKIALVQLAISYAAEQESIVQQLTEQLAAAPSADDHKEALDQIAELGKKLDMQETTRQLGGIVVEHDNVSKMLIGNRFRLNGKLLTAREVANDPDSVAYLFKIRSGSLVDVPEKDAAN